LRIATTRRNLGCPSLAALVAALGFALALVSPSGRLSAVDSIRGDANSDERVSISDAHFLLNRLLRGQIYPERLKSGDADSDGKIHLADAIQLLKHLVLTGAPPAAPFPSPGPDDGVVIDGWINGDGCGSGSQIEDPAARIAILDATAGGGTDGIAVIALAIPSSAPLAGCSATIAVDTSVVGNTTSEEWKDLAGALRRGFAGVRLSDGRLRIGFLTTLADDEPTWISSLEAA